MGSLGASTVELQGCEWVAELRAIGAFHYKQRTRTCGLPMTETDPDETPTRFGDGQGPKPEDRTTPSIKGAGAEKPKAPAGGADADETPTRFAGSEKAPGPKPEDRTLPAFKGVGKDKPKDKPKAPVGGDADPDDTPTRVGGSDAKSRGPGSNAEEDRTLPAMKGAGGQQAKVPMTAGPKDPLIGKQLGGCRIDTLLGRGAMGAVYKARQMRLDRDVAIKIIRPEMMTDPRTLKRFEVEARTVGKFNSQHVVMVHDVGFELGVHFLVMEFVQGKNMREHTKLLAGGRLPAGEAIPLLRQACKGLEEAQRLAVIHRDIKPDNLMLTDRGVLKIADFGIAKPIQEDFNMTMTSELIGTPLYMSPEQCQGSATQLDFRSDMYSLGATFYYLLTGEPPIRASSVYELIQTKTKLEHLCLWKALPDLGENHPLSRVIERMTALDRDDRYESYEALFNDIVLVEQGGTVNIPAKVAPKPKPVVVAAAKQKPRTALYAILLVVVAGGAGYMWLPRTPIVPSGVPDPEVVKSTLNGLRQRLAREGPSEILRNDLNKLVPDEAQKAQRADLLEDVKNGMRVKDQFEKIKPPGPPVLPFKDLDEHFKLVDAVQVAGSPGKELREWVESARRTRRAESQLGDAARAVLTSAFSQWESDCSKAAGNKTKLVELATRLDEISAARSNLFDILPGQREALNTVLPAVRLQTAKERLSKPGPRTNEVDVSADLARIRGDFERDGPLAAFTDRTTDLKPTSNEQIAAREALLNEIKVAADAQNQARAARASNSYPSDPKLPFKDVGDYYAMLERALDPVRRAGKLPAWAEKVRMELREEPSLQFKVVGACQRECDRLKGLRADPGTAIDVLTSGLAVLKSGIAKATELFEGARAQLESIVPAAMLSQMETDLARDQKRQVWFGDAAKALAQIKGVSTLADWRVAKTAIVAELERLGSSRNDFATAPEVERIWKQAVDARDRWLGADKNMADLAAKIASGDLTGAESVARTITAAEGRDELRLLADAAAKCRDAFEAIDKDLAIQKASTLLTEARSVLKPVVTLAPAADEHIKTWVEKIEALKSSATGMVPIASGTTKASPEKVSSFFLSATECSYAEYTQFLKELKAEVAGIADRQQRLEKVAAKLFGAELTADRLQELLDSDPRKQPDKMPIDKVTWYGAAACAAWNGRALPTLAEWSLAAFGDGNRSRFPWGPEPSNDPQKRNPNPEKFAEVDMGGLSWRLSDNVRIYHLGGNVAEWLATAPGATSAMVAGGRANDRSEANAREQAEGKPLPAEKNDNRAGFGFRTVLRPRSFPGLQWPR